MITREPLTFEQFTEKDPTPRFNNFFVYFSDTDNGRTFYRNIAYFQKFAQEHPEIERDLTEKITKRDMEIATTKSLIPFERELYAAYLIMREYVEDESELFR